MSFYYAQDKDAFKDIDDLRFRNMPTFAQAMAMKQPSGVVAVPNRKALYRTDANGNPIQLTDEEIALRNNAANGLQQQAAAEAATPAGGNKWYEFLKNPQNTPYEQKQMRNQEIMRDAAIGSMLMKPIFNPDTDISEGMVRMAGQQQGMAQAAMDNYLKRQGMAADMYNSATKLATNYAAQSLQAQIQSQQEISNAENREREAAIRADQAKKQYDDVTKSPEYIAAVEKNNLAKQQELLAQYNAYMRDALYLQSEAQKHRERSQQFLGKAKSFGDGARQISKDWELGLNLDLDNVPSSVSAPPSVGEFKKQGEVGHNGAGIFTPNAYTGAAPAGTPSTGFSPQGATEVPPSAQTAPTGPANSSTGEPAEVPTNTPAKPVSGGEKYSFDGKKLTKSDPIMNRIARLSNGNRDVDIARWKAAGSRVDLDTGIQAAADKNAWLTELQAVANDIVSRPENFAKYKDFIYKIIEGGERFGNAYNIIMKSPMNPPKYKGLFNYNNDILTYNRNKELQDNYLQMLNGFPLTEQEVKRTEILLSDPKFSVMNAKGEAQPILLNNGLKLKAVEARDDKGQPILYKGQKTYFVDVNDSFK